MEQTTSTPTPTNHGVHRCWFCHDTERDEMPPGGWLIDDRVWRAGAAPASYAIPGTVILESRRHVLDQANFDERERGTVADVTGRLLAAIREATGCNRVYQWATMDGYPHFHLWLVPWSFSSDLRGPHHLVASVINVQPDPATTLHTANAIATALNR